MNSLKALRNWLNIFKVQSTLSRPSSTSIYDFSKHYKIKLGSDLFQFGMHSTEIKREYLDNKSLFLKQLNTWIFFGGKLKKPFFIQNVVIKYVWIYFLFITIRWFLFSTTHNWRNFFFKNVALGVDSPLLIFFYCDVTKNGVRSKQSRPKQILL